MAENNSTPAIPSWLKAESFQQVLKEAVPKYDKVKDFHVEPAAPGQNVSMDMFKVEIVVELKDGITQNKSYMIKTLQDHDWVKEYGITDAFSVERGMFIDIMPELEAMYAAAGADVKLCARAYTLPVKSRHLALENLKVRGFKNADRLQGLDTEHMENALKKMAVFHAASATRVQTKGKYEDKYTLGFYADSRRAMLTQLYEGLGKQFLEAMKDYDGHEVYIEAVKKRHANMVDDVFLTWRGNDTEFKVLNHCDFWTNNVMFQYDEEGKIRETYLVDLAGPLYATPAIDLIYFIISSGHHDIKLSKFDYFIKYYHDNLVKNLKLLKYPKQIPSLKDIHVALINYGIYGYTTVVVVMAANFMDAVNDSNAEIFLGTSEAAQNYRKHMFSNPRYRKHAELILPWLYNRGALEMKLN